MNLKSFYLSRQFLKTKVLSMSNTDDNYLGILLEELRDQNKALLEGIKDLPTRWEFNELRRDVDGIKQSASVLKVAIADLSQDVKVIKDAVSDNDHELADHGRRITQLEAA